MVYAETVGKDEFKSVTSVGPSSAVSFHPPPLTASMSSLSTLTTSSSEYSLQTFVCTCIHMCTVYTTHVIQIGKGGIKLLVKCTNCRGLGIVVVVSKDCGSLEHVKLQNREMVIHDVH